MRLKSISLIFVLICTFTFASGQTTDAEKKLKTVNADTIMGWKKGGVFGLSLAQTSLSNWAAGGQNSLSVNGIFSAFANYKKGKSAWDNTIDLGYGILKQGKDGIVMKTDDKIDLLSKYGRQAINKLYYAALLNFRTQMRPGYKYPDTENKISDIFAPAYLLLAAGIDYKPSAYFTAFFAPLTGKFTFVTDKILSDAGPSALHPGKKPEVKLAAI